MNVLLLGNPNVGKTSLFNHLTKSNARVGNYPGITIDRRESTVTIAREGKNVDAIIVDSPGTYSLSARSREEQITLQSLLGEAGGARPDVVVAVVNASQLSRNLYIVSQLLELRVPTIIALNMGDEAGPDAPSAKVLSEKLGVPCVATRGDTGAGADELLSEMARVFAANRVQLPSLSPNFSPEIRAAADRIAEFLPPAWRGSVERDRTLALWALASLDKEDELVGIPPALRDTVREVRDDGYDYDLHIVEVRYAAIDELLNNLHAIESAPSMRASERLDRIFLHPILGFVTFMLAMLIVFQALFSWSDPFISMIEFLVAQTQSLASGVLPPGIFADLVIEGIIGGVGNVIVFLPQILLLFVFVGLLEDSGYMARVAYLMDRIMRSLGLHGRAFVPMLSGFACAIPAILATRTLENRRDRLLTMMVVPLMTCSARLPVYTLLIAAIYPVHTDSGWPLQGLMMIGLYLFSVVVSLIAAWVLGRTIIPGNSVPLILELPPYRWPRLLPIFRMVRLRARQFLKEAGTVILAATIVLWALLSFPRVDATAAFQENGVAPATSMHAVSSAPPLENSYAGRLGKTLEPVAAPLGFDWKITTAIIGAFAAREVFISTLALVYGIGEMDDEAVPLRDRIRAEKKPDGSPVYSPLMGLSLLVFFALACQCMSTLAVVKRETQSWRWPGFLFFYMTALAYICSLAIYQGGLLLGY